MTFKTDHLSDAQLAKLVSGELRDAGAEFHFGQCMDCKRELGRSLVLGGLLRPPSDPSQTGHLSPRAMDQFHAAAFEGEAMGVPEFLSAYRHISACESCYARFFAWHEHLTPRQALRERVLSNFAESAPTRTLGVLTLVRNARAAYMTFVRKLAPEAEPLSLTETVSRTLALSERREPSERAREWFTRPSLSSARRASTDFERFDAELSDEGPSEYELEPLSHLDTSDLAPPVDDVSSPPSQPAEIAVDGLKVTVVIEWHDDPPILKASATELGAGTPRADVLVELLDRRRRTVTSRRTAEDGTASLPIPTGTAAIRLRSAPDHKPWVIDLVLRDSRRGSPR